MIASLPSAVHKQMIEAKSLSPTPEHIARAAALLRAGELVVLPTDTVYGIVADAFSAEAINALFAAKQRPLTKGLPVLISDVRHLERVAIVPDNTRIQSWFEAFWPGSLTLIFERHPDLPAVIAPQGGIAVRLPDHTVARAVIEQAGGAVASSSANRSGKPPATSAAAAAAQLGSAVAAIIDDGLAPGGIPSTIVDCTLWPPRIVRAGPISAEHLRDV